MILHEAVTNANLRAVADALAQRPDDVNLLDDSQRSVLFCAIVGRTLSRPAPNSPERNAILKSILSRPELSIYALNAGMDSAKGATPLVLACMLGRLEHVNILLDCPSVLVDTRDASGLTPLMHAVHGQHLQIVSALLRSGARVNILDPFYRSIFQYSQNSHIRILLENQLRVERSPRAKASSHASLSDSSSNGSGSSSSHPKPITHAAHDSITTATEDRSDDLFCCLIRAINANDLRLLRASLEVVVREGSRFSTANAATFLHQPYSILNKLDEFGFAPIHHAMFCRPPNFAIVDALYRAGADVNLLTSTLKSPLQIMVEYAKPSYSDENHTLHLLVRRLIQDLGASLRYRDDQMETSLHLAAEHGSCREILEALVQCDTDAVVREWKNKRNLRPVDIAKPEYRNVFGDRPDSMCTLRPLRSKRSLASVSSFSSFTSVSSMASSITIRSPTSSNESNEPPVISMSLQEALKGSQILLDEIDLSLLQRTLFYRSSLDMDRAVIEGPKAIDESLSRTSVSVISYWNSCLSLIREELDAVQKAVVKSHLLVARTKREVDQRSRDDERELTQAILLWEEQQAVEERIAVKDQARGRAFTAPAWIPDSPSDSESSQRFWMLPRKWSLSGSSSPAEGIPLSPSEATIKRPNRVASFIKQKLRPGSRNGPETPTRVTRPRVPPLQITPLDSYETDHGVEEASIEAQIGHNMRHLSLSQSQSVPSTPTKTMYRRPSTATISTRGTIRKAPVVLTRLHTDLLRIEEYIRGIHILARDFKQETENAASLIEHCLIRCAQAEENEYEDEMQLERLRSLLLVGLERKVDEMCEALEVVRKWNTLVRSLLREFRRKVKGGEQIVDTHGQHYVARPQTAT